MKLKKNIALFMLAPVAMANISVSVKANEPESQTVIAVNGQAYNAQEFMDRVLEYTIQPAPVENVQADDGTEVRFTYNTSRQRTEKVKGKDRTLYQYDEFSNLKAQYLPNRKWITYSYQKTGYDTFAKSISYGNKQYYYQMEDGIITGLLNEKNQIVCTYSYDENGATKHIYEWKGKKKEEHSDQEGDDFVGCVNSIRYDGKCYDSETEMFCMDGNYYDTKTDKMVGGNCYVDMKGLFGDQYETLRRQERQQELKNGGKKAVICSIPSAMQSALVYAATQKYNDALNEKHPSYEKYGSSWYTAFQSSSVQYKLAARIIYAENTNLGSASDEKNFLKYNRQGIAWVIANRLLEDKYRKSKGKRMCFSDASTPSLYSVLTKRGAFVSLYSDNAMGEIRTSVDAYQQALLLACYINVCSNFDQYDAVLPRPSGVTYQCYNKGALTKDSKPVAKWSNVRFPGDSTAYTGKKDYSAFKYYSSIGLFNVLHSYAEETLSIQSVYY
ncbi:hypothetical protein [[Clostridium] polysaccharolyticum]|uniref:YD repeat-containing protein n=1 Tax=[Clostridium] polysaccharolyticum TaxID=29364 RepID=A0A1H9Y4P7_9FIRM|nr:hypothetical protein [[Clostridium] polysaccharolyticum]SES63804.1 hypothetical protein SAMN04487772_101140 [[Clostridium] polysaccharolyticum]